jgi:hypothetical protein
MGAGPCEPGRTDGGPANNNIMAERDLLARELGMLEGLGGLAAEAAV